ncbi:MAG: MFS transporter [Lysobacteraceae bacterium]|nr:MAG: MFS transporter [Xanthomonadaceae bacterium]
MSADAGSAESMNPPLRNRGFLHLMAYRLLTILSYQIVAVSVGWHVYELTNDPWKLGLLGLAEVLPFFCVAPFAGYLVDHLPKRRLGVIACVGLAITPILLAVVAWGLVFGKADALAPRLWLIYAAVMFTGMVRSFLGPVYNTLFACVLPRTQFTRGSGVGSVVFQSALALGPAIGGGLIALVDWFGDHPEGDTVQAGPAYALAALCAFGAAFVLATLRTREPERANARDAIFTGIAEGLRFVFRTPVMLGAMALDMFAVLFGGAVSLAPAFSKDILHADAWGLGLLRGAPAVGAAMVGLWLARHPIERNSGKVMLYAVAGFGLCIIGFGLSELLWLSVLLMFLSGVCDGVSVVIRSTILQLATPDHMRGRVSSINSVFISSSNELGSFYAGSMARLLGLVHAVVLGGCVTLGIVGFTALKSPILRRLHLRDLQ